jgi:hypothetical protein
MLEGKKIKILHCKKNHTLKALEIVESILSRMNPPARVPNIPHTIVIPPNIRSALPWYNKFDMKGYPVK